MTKSTRRKFLLNTLKILETSAIILWFTKNKILRWVITSTNNEGLAMTASPKIGDDMCMLTSKQGEGPFLLHRQFEAILLRTELANK